MNTSLDKKKIKNRIHWFCKNKVNAFSPTISPAPKSAARNEIESLYEGIRFYLDLGINEILIQKKYMGSYCDIYLHRNIEESYLISRNAYQISHFSQDEIVEALSELHQKLDWTNLQRVIIQSELMPWSALGKKLIDNEYGAYLISHKTHFNYLKESSLYDKLNQLKASETYKTFVEDKAVLSAKALKSKYEAHVIRQYKSIENFPVFDLDKYKKNITRFERQLDLFGKQDKLHFKPFNILKTIDNEGNECIINDNLSFAQVNDDDFLHYRFSSEKEFEEAFPEIEKWVHLVNQNEEEGVMIKPRICFQKNIPPALKVRNNDYLTLIYGVDFQDNLAYQIKKRNIKKKVNCSVNDWMINWKLLQIPYCEINQENYLLKNLVFDRILGENIENKLDTRL